MKYLFDNKTMNDGNDENQRQCGHEPCAYSTAVPWRVRSTLPYFPPPKEGGGVYKNFKRNFKKNYFQNILKIFSKFFFTFSKNFQMILKTQYLQKNFQNF